MALGKEPRGRKSYTVSKVGKRADAALTLEIEQKRNNFVNKVTDMPEKNYYAEVKKLGNPHSKSSLGAADLFPGAGVEEVGEGVLEYFSSVGGDCPPSTPPVLVVPSNAGLGHFDAARVVKLLKDQKKTLSTVDGDPLLPITSPH